MAALSLTQPSMLRESTLNRESSFTFGSTLNTPSVSETPGQVEMPQLSRNHSLFGYLEVPSMSRNQSLGRAYDDPFGASPRGTEKPHAMCVLCVLARNNRAVTVLPFPSSTSTASIRSQLCSSDTFDKRILRDNQYSGIILHILHLLLLNNSKTNFSMRREMQEGTPLDRVLEVAE